MGIALARESVRRGRPTTLLLGPVTSVLPRSSLLQVVRFESTADLQTLLEAHAPGHRLVIMAAAVADFIPRAASDTGTKLSRRDGPMHLELDPAPDLLEALAQRRVSGQRLIGFALEPGDDLREAAARKLARKGIDAIVANPLETMEAETVSGLLLGKDGACLEAPPDMPKAAFAAWLWDALGQLFPS